VEVCRRLVDAGVHVIPVLTKDATRFVGEVTFSALASEPVRRSLWSEKDPIPHTRLGQSADLIVVVPATARFLAAYAHGSSDGLLTATVLATRAPVMVAPAMHTEMWEHPAVQENLAVLTRRGVHVVAPEEGRLAGGDRGAGRLADPERIVAAALALLAGAAPGSDPEVHGAPEPDLRGVRVLVSAGGTREPIDPVRVITNRSSGKQGHALAEAAMERGAAVTLVTTTDRPVPAGISVVRVDTAAEMESALSAAAGTAEVIVMAAAVSDFRPKICATRKLVKSEGLPEIVLEPTPDILAGLAARRPPGQVLVGFAAETHDVIARATAKLAAKGVDLIVANDVGAPGAGFDHDTNIVTILSVDGSRKDVTLTSKRAVADAVLDSVVKRLSVPTPGVQTQSDLRSNS
jgi:phosphopantothenoylcysteine decarboxylase/phosphopantothenate--cysteine ligase